MLAASQDSEERARELAEQERRVSRHLLRVQQERFEAKNGNDPNKLKRLEKEFRRTQKRYGDVHRESQHPSPAP